MDFKNFRLDIFYDLTHRHIVVGRQMYFPIMLPTPQWQRASLLQDAEWNIMTCYMFIQAFLFLKFSQRGKLSAGVSSLSKQNKQKKPTELVIKTSLHLKWGNLTSLFSVFPKVLLSGLKTAIAGKIVLRQRSENRPGSLNLKGRCAQTNSNRWWNALARISPLLLAFTQRLNAEDRNSFARSFLALHL